jgi:hypothetical protein
MTIHNQLAAAEDILQSAQDSAAKHLQSVAGKTGINDNIIDSYSMYLEKSILSAQSLLKLCGTLVTGCVNSDEHISRDVTESVRKLIKGMLDSLNSMDLAITVDEDFL